MSVVQLHPLHQSQHLLPPCLHPCLHLCLLLVQVQAQALVQSRYEAPLQKRWGFSRWLRLCQRQPVPVQVQVLQPQQAPLPHLTRLARQPLQ